MNLLPSRRQMLAAGLGLSALPAQISARRPNVLVILADDQGWGDLSANGNTNLSTPNIDSIARRGARFDRFYVCSVCAPTRAEFLTGRYHPRGGVRGVSTGAERLNLDETTIADTFRSAGYATGAFGKWHNGSQHPYHPNARGFDEFYGVTSGHWGHYFDTEMNHNGALVRGRGFIADDLTDHAIRFIDQNAGRPFFCYVPFNTPHSPFQVPDSFFRKFASFEPALRAAVPGQENIAQTRASLAMTENIDANVGRLLRKLGERRLENDTIVLYFSDNGPDTWRWNGGMKGRKGSLDEGGLRSPLMMRWPGRIPAGLSIPQIAAAIDLLPTLADLSGVPLRPKKPLDGRSLSPLLNAAPPPWPDRRIFSMQAKRVSVRTQQYRLDPAGALYDITGDPGQTRDVAAARPAEAAALRRAAGEWAQEMLPLVGSDTRPFTVGYAPLTELPARDGVPHGGVERSASAPNSSYFTRWTSAGDRITWDIELAATGSFHADLYYTCPAGDEGSRIQLNFRDEKIEAAVAPPHDPPLIGAAQDRVPRTQSYVKDFRPLRLGTIRLEKGRGELTLRAVKVAGRTVADVRRLVLTRA